MVPQDCNQTTEQLIHGMLLLYERPFPVCPSQVTVHIAGLLTCSWALTKSLYSLEHFCPFCIICSNDKKKKVKWSRYRPGVAQMVGRGIALLFHDHGTRKGWVFSSTPRPQFTPWKTWYPFYRRLGGPQGWSGWAENLVPTGFRSRTIQPVVSCYTKWGTQPTICSNDTFHYSGEKWFR